MFTLRKEHEAAFRAVLQETFEDRALAHVRKVLPEAAAPFSDEALRGRMRICLDQCRAYGLTLQHQAIFYIDAALLLGAKGDLGAEYAWAREILSNPDLSSDAKAEQLLHKAYAVSAERRPRESGQNLK